MIVRLLFSLLLLVPGAYAAEKAKAKVKTKPQIKMQDTVPALLQQLKNENCFLRSQAALKLSARNVKSQAVANQLILMLDDPDRIARLSALKALGHVRSKKAIPPLTNKLEQGVETEQAYAAIALGYYGAQARQAIPLLILGSTSANKYVRGASLAALDEIMNAGKPSRLTYEQKIMRNILISGMDQAGLH